MIQPFKHLSLVEIANANVRCSIAPNRNHMAASLESAASDVMTDFSLDHPIVITPCSSVDDALKLMESGRVRMLVVASDTGDFEGLIRSSDIYGPGPIIAAQHNGVTRESILVSDVMRPKHSLHGLDIEEVESARIGDVMSTLKHLGEPDILVIDNSMTPPTIRGLLSVSDISRELRIDFDVLTPAQTFSDLELALMVD